MGWNTDSPLPLCCSPAEQETLIRLARRSMVAAIQGRGLPSIPESELTENLQQQAATFVTLHFDGKLRGCVGNLVAREPLYRSVMHNAVGAALRDTRFDSVTLVESNLVRIHLSILSPLIPIQFDSEEQLLDQLRPEEDGVVLRRTGKVATYLPQVWKVIPAKEAFLDSLSEKAGLKAGAWKEPDSEILLYRVFEFHEANES